MLGRELDHVVVRAHAGFGAVAEHAAQADVAERADQREHRAQHPQRDVVAQLVDDLVGPLGVRREARFLALHVGDLVAQAGGQIGQLFRAFDDVAALEAQQQAHVEHLERLQVDAAVRAQAFQAVEEVLAGQLVAEQQCRRLPNRAECRYSCVTSSPLVRAYKGTTSTGLPGTLMVIRLGRMRARQCNKYMLQDLVNKNRTLSFPILPFLE